jgi:hypothetical protein
MELKEKDKLLLLYEETTNLIPESNKLSKEKLDKVDSTLNNKYNLVENIIKDHNLDIKKFKSWINTINKNETEIKQYSTILEQISEKLDTTLSINKFEYDIQEKTIHTLNEQYNLLKTIQIREEKQKKDLQALCAQPLNLTIFSQKLKNIIDFYENITGIRIEKDKNEKDVFIVHAFEGFNLLNDLKSCDFSIKLKHGKFYIVKMNPIFNAKPYEEEINRDNGEIKNLGFMIGKIIINEFPQYVIT